jgi:ATP-binding cassette subfamily B protein
MLALNVRLTLLALIPMPIIALFTLRAGKMLHSRFEKVQETFSSLTERVRESMSGIRVVKAYSQEEHELASLATIGEEYVRDNIRLVRVWGAFFPFIMMLSSMSVVIIIYFGGSRVMLGDITTGDLVAFTSGDAGRYHHRRSGGVHELPWNPDLAHDSHGVGRQRAPARRGFDGQDQQDPRGHA